MIKKGIIKVQSFKTKTAVVVGAALALPTVASAQTATPPIDVTDIATDIVGWVGGAAVAGFGIWGAIIGIRYIKRAFRAGAS